MDTDSAVKCEAFSDDEVSEDSINKKRKLFYKDEKYTWSVHECEQLISMWKNRPCLWCLNHIDYNNTRARELAYKDMATVLSIPMFEVRGKMNNLRTQFGRELTKARKWKEGMREDAVYRTKWIYWDKLQWLTPVMRASRSNESKNSPDEAEAGNSEDGFNAYMNDNDMEATGSDCEYEISENTLNDSDNLYQNEESQQNDCANDLIFEHQLDKQLEKAEFVSNDLPNMEYVSDDKLKYSSKSNYSHENMNKLNERNYSSSKSSYKRHCSLPKVNEMRKIPSNHYELRKIELMEKCSRNLDSVLNASNVSVFAKYIDDKLFSMSHKNRIVAEKKIVDVLFEFEKEIYEL